MSVSKSTSLAVLGALAVFAVAGASPGLALSAKECSARYNTAKDAGNLKGMNWNQYQKTECAGVTATAEPTPEKKVAKADKPVIKPAAKSVTAPAAAASGNAVFPKAVDPKYAKESAGKARMHTCLDQYHANKTSNGNGGMKWIQKGGGYYSLCNTSLKG